MPDHDNSPKTSGDVRALIGLTLGLLGCSVALAEVAAWVLRKTAKAPNAELTVSVWWAALRPELVPQGKVPSAAVVLLDVTVEGILSDYTLSADSVHRDVALNAPIHVTAQGILKKTPYQVTVIPADQIKHVSVKYVNK